MRIAVVGSGPAGMTAAYRLQQNGHTVEVLEARAVVGGRTHAERLGPGHHVDTGAGWLTSFYSRTLALLDELGWRDLLVRPRNVRGAADLLTGGRVYHAGTHGERAAAQLLSPSEQRALAGYLERVYAEQAADLEVDPAADERSAEAELQPLGPRVVDYVFRPWFEGPFFTPLRDISAAMLRSWLKAYVGATFYQVAGGMDTPWLRLAERVGVQLGTPVEALRLSGGVVELELPSGARRYDGAVLACPATVSARLLGAHVAEVLPCWPRYATRRSCACTLLGKAPRIRRSGSTWCRRRRCSRWSSIPARAAPGAPARRIGSGRWYVLPVPTAPSCSRCPPPRRAAYYGSALAR